MAPLDGPIRISVADASKASPCTGVDLEDSLLEEFKLVFISRVGAGMFYDIILNL